MSAPGTFDIVIPKYQWPGGRLMSLNDRGQWAARARATKAWRMTGRLYGRNAIHTGLPHPLPTPVTVTMGVRYQNNKRRDIANTMPTAKALIDGLRDAGLLADDHDGVLVGPFIHRLAPNGYPTLTLTLTWPVPAQDAA